MCFGSRAISEEVKERWCCVSSLCPYHWDLLWFWKEKNLNPSSSKQAFSFFKKSCLTNELDPFHSFCKDWKVYSIVFKFSEILDSISETFQWRLFRYFRLDHWRKSIPGPRCPYNIWDASAAIINGFIWSASLCIRDWSVELWYWFVVRLSEWILRNIQDNVIDF